MANAYFLTILISLSDFLCESIEFNQICFLLTPPLKPFADESRAYSCLKMEKMIISRINLNLFKKKRGNLVEFNKLRKRVALLVATWTAALITNRFRRRQ